MWKEKLTFPPFNPKQIEDQFHWSRAKDGTYGGSEEEPKWIYKQQLRSSASNLHNRVAGFTESGLFVWFTSNTELNMHGSLMVYLVENEEIMTWYASFKNESKWVVDITKGINKEVVEKWFPI